MIWGDNHCEHKWGIVKKKKFNTVQGGDAQRPHNFIMEQDYTQGSFCSLCGAWRGAYGLEPAPDCGRPFMKLRDDLTPEQKEYVLSELRKFETI